MNPIETPDEFDYIILAGKMSPGLCDVSGAASPRDWDVRKGYGLSGATVVYTGDGLAEFTVRLFLWESTHFQAYSTWKTLIKKTAPNVKPRAMDIQHPYLADLEITSVVVADTLQMQQPTPGLWTKDIKFKQYKKPLPQISKPTDNSMSKPNEPIAQTDAEKQIAALVAQVKALNG